MADEFGFALDCDLGADGEEEALGVGLGDGARGGLGGPPEPDGDLVAEDVLVVGGGLDPGKGGVGEVGAAAGALAPRNVLAAMRPTAERPVDTRKSRREVFIERGTKN